jgi:L-cystine uptake protein TcyP (sodium:dicarboxylate symporter family)
VSRGGWTVVLALAAIVVLAVVGVALFWVRTAEVELGLHGYLALGLGIAATIGLWVLLMRLVYISHKRGYDDRAHHD